jgi:MFS transporter, DHA3 family, macrolide efflux protein
MRSILRRKGLRFIFIANVVSMLGSGMNSAAVAWHILQVTHSEIALGTFAVVQTLPAILLLPFTGVIIDREDRRRLVMMLDAVRAIIILAVALLAFAGRVKIWELYLMNMLVAAGFWMFWPTITALIQELTPEDEFVHANTFLLAGVQGGWLIAGSIVGFVYNWIGLGGVLLIDVSTYVVSFLCYLAVRKGRHVVPRPSELHADIVAAETAFAKFFREMREGIQFLRGHREIVALGLSWALFLSAMMTGVVVTAPLSDDVYHKGAVGYGWLNGGWGMGAFVSAFYAPHFIRKFGSRRAIAISLGVLAVCMTSAPTMPFLALAVLIYAIMGSGRWNHWRRHEHQFDGADPAALHGTGAEHVLHGRDNAASAPVVSGGRGGATQSDCGIFRHRPGVCDWVPERNLANACATSCSCWSIGLAASSMLKRRL